MWVPPGNLLDMQVLHPTSGQLNRELWRWVNKPSRCFGCRQMRWEPLLLCILPGVVVGGKRHSKDLVFFFSSCDDHWWINSKAVLDPGAHSQQQLKCAVWLSCFFPWHNHAGIFHWYFALYPSFLWLIAWCSISWILQCTGSHCIAMTLVQPYLA